MHNAKHVFYERSGIPALLALASLFANTLHSAEALPSLELKVAFPELKFNRPLWMEEFPDGSRRLVVVEQAGKVFVIPHDRSAAEPITFLDISDRKPFVQNEEGLLAFAFHPQFKTNGAFYIYYSQQAPKRSVLSEIRVSKEDP